MAVAPWAVAPGGTGPKGWSLNAGAEDRAALHWGQVRNMRQDATCRYYARTHHSANALEMTMMAGDFSNDERINYRRGDEEWVRFRAAWPALTEPPPDFNKLLLGMPAPLIGS